MDRDAQDISNIAGNASEELKRFLSSPASIFLGKGPGGDGFFGAPIIKRMTVKEVSVVNKSEEPSKKEGRVVCELVTEEDMLNRAGSMHGGCSAFLIDICSTMALIALGLASGNLGAVNTVSQTLNILYHSPAVAGDTLRIVNTTITLGSRALSARTEIWSDTHHRLVASGSHIKMQPSLAKANL
ncbi:HotDog domain-containing protein [Amanita rubescens]|nr:HotDog domain-containing protein [Amanita rubescens]